MGFAARRSSDDRRPGPGPPVRRPSRAGLAGRGDARASSRRPASRSMGSRSGSRGDRTSPTTRCGRPSWPCSAGSRGSGASRRGPRGASGSRCARPSASPPVGAAPRPRGSQAPQYTDLPWRLEPLPGAGPVGDTRGPAAGAEDRDRAARILAPVASLPPLLRAVFALAEMDGLPRAEVVEILGVPVVPVGTVGTVGTVDSRLHAARERLTRRLSGER